MSGRHCKTPYEGRHRLQRVPRQRPPMRRAAALRVSRFALLGGLVAGILTSCDRTVPVPTFDTPSASQPAQPTAQPSATPDIEVVSGNVNARDALRTLKNIPVKGRAPKTGYSRDKFKHWDDADHDGCDTREEILERDAIEMTWDAKHCAAQVTIHDPYSDTDIKDRKKIDIDHIVALSDAWQKGAQQLTAVQRESFANDPLNLLAVSASQNRQKGDGDAATWLPMNRSFWCAYVSRQVAVKAKYDLWMTDAEKTRISQILQAC